MSFDVNPIGDMRASKSQDGGAGNTGYFAGNRKKKDDVNSMNQSVFGDTSQDTDTFTLEDAEEETYKEPPLLLKIVNSLKNLVKVLFHSLLHGN